MSLLTASDTYKRKKTVPYVCGYELAGCSAFDGGLATSESVDHYFGQTDPTTENVVDNATLSATVTDRATDNVILNAVTRQDPDDTSEKRFKFTDILNTTAWENRLDRAGTSYEHSTIYKQWLPTPGQPEGGPNEIGTRTFAGNAAATVEYTAPIIGEKVVMSGSGPFTGTLTKAVPLVIPGTSFYAIEVHAIEETRSGSALTAIEMDNLVVTAAMVTVGQAISIPAAALTKTTAPDYAYVIYLYDSADGIPSTIDSDGQFKDMT